jgi:hypothetical protein
MRWSEGFSGGLVVRTITRAALSMVRVPGYDRGMMLSRPAFRLAYLTVTNAFAALRLLPMSDRDKDVEIVALRHQITVLERQLSPSRARFAPEDRALLAALLAPLPREVLRRLRLLALCVCAAISAPPISVASVTRAARLAHRRHPVPSGCLSACSRSRFWNCRGLIPVADLKWRCREVVLMCAMSATSLILSGSVRYERIQPTALRTYIRFESPRAT